MDNKRKKDFIIIMNILLFIITILSFSFIKHNVIVLLDKI